MTDTAARGGATNGSPRPAPRSQPATDQTHHSAPRSRSIRIVPELRAVHLERHPLTAPARNLYFTEKYDMIGSIVPQSVLRVTTRGALRLLLHAEESILELPEPLWMRFLPKWLILATAWRLGGIVRGRRRFLCFYAMELTPFPTLLTGGRVSWNSGNRLAAAVIGTIIRIFTSRMCFASEASAALYATLPGIRRVPQRTILELPSPVTDPQSARSRTATYLGVLEDRGGVRHLMRAWERVEDELVGSELTIIGAGSLLATVRRWAARRPDSRKVTGALPRQDALRHVGRTTVLVAPSVPEGRWREQIGLPIKEGLAAGATVVTTDQSGLAPWLRDNGHAVLRPDRDLSAELAEALVRTLGQPLDREGVRLSLPAVDGRIVSDAWLHHPEGSEA